MKQVILVLALLGLACAQDCNQEFGDCGDAGADSGFGSCQQISERPDGKALCLQNHRVQQACDCTCYLLVKCDKKPEKPTDPPTDPPTEPPTREPSNPDVAPPPECFSGDGIVQTEEGQMSIEELAQRPDARVKVIDGSGTVRFSDVRLWLHIEPEVTADYVELTTESGHTLSVTRNHLVYEVPCNGGNHKAIYAHRLSAGQCILVDNGGDVVEPTQIVSATVVPKQGVYSFTTETGSVLVNGVAASNYNTMENEKLQHMFFSAMYHARKFVPRMFVNNYEALQLNIIDSLFDHAVNSF